MCEESLTASASASIEVVCSLQLIHAVPYHMLNEERRLVGIHVKYVNIQMFDLYASLF